MRTRESRSKRLLNNRRRLMARWQDESGRLARTTLLAAWRTGNDLQIELINMLAVDGEETCRAPRLDLRCINLSGENLAGVDLSGMSLQGANLARASLRDAKLVGADLRDTLLRNTDFTGADLRQVNFDGAVMENTYFEGANLDGAYLSAKTIVVRTQVPSGALMEDPSSWFVNRPFIADELE